jgi:hypothetical protein
MNYCELILIWPNPNEKTKTIPEKNLSNAVKFQNLVTKML